MSTEMEVRCPECDYILTGSAANRCPWCGWRIDVETLAARAGKNPVVRCVGIIIACTFLGLGFLVSVAALVSHGTHLSLQDGFTFLAVFSAGSGHLCLAVLASRSTHHWPLRQIEFGYLLRFVGWLSVLLGVLGASGALTMPRSAHGVQGVEVHGMLEFVLQAFFFTLPGWTLLGLRLVSFRKSDLRPRGLRSTGSAADNTPSHEALFTVELFGRYSRDQLTQKLVDEPKPTTPAIEAAVARTWEAQCALAEMEGRHLYNGELARLIRAEVLRDDKVNRSVGKKAWLALTLGPTCYRDFAGTNLFNAPMVVGSGVGCLANPLGISATVVTLDGYLMFGRRSREVLYHATYLHPFGGMLEPTDRNTGGSYDVFGCALRELQEELGLQAEEVVEIMITGLVRDRSLYQPELLFEVAVKKTQEALTKRFLQERSDGQHTGMGEHTNVECVRDHPEAVLRFLEHGARITPVCQAAILLHGWHRWGRRWYEESCKRLYGQQPPVVGWR